jgi:hypothetical protein
MTCSPGPRVTTAESPHRTGAASRTDAATLLTMSKRTQKKKAKARRSKANHGRKPNVGRNS